MEHREVVLGVFLPAGEDAPEAVKPGMGALDDPAPGPPSGFVLERGDFLAAGAQVQREFEFLGEVAHLVVVIALIQTQTLRTLLGRLGARDDDAL